MNRIPPVPGRKAEADNFVGRFREVISDPLNLLIKRHPFAGYVGNGAVVLHNGHKVGLTGPLSYYGEFSQILILNRGVHEPLEEFVFQTLLEALPEAPVMIELGAYWAHYSMWLKQKRPQALVHMVEPEAANIAVGQHNFKVNGYEGQFIQAFVGEGHFTVDGFVAAQGLSHINILHSDIQGFELEMLDGAADSFARRLVDYAMISTHSQELHAAVIQRLRDSGFRIEVDSDFDHHTTSYDGFVFASRNDLPPVLPGFAPLGREEIARSTPTDLLKALLTSRPGSTRSI
jgi:hypothetical protein